MDLQLPCMEVPISQEDKVEVLDGLWLHKKEWDICNNWDAMQSIRLEVFMMTGKHPKLGNKEIDDIIDDTLSSSSKEEATNKTNKYIYG